MHLAPSPRDLTPDPPRRRPRAALAILAVLVALAAPSARAAEPAPLRPLRRPLTLLVGAGPALGINRGPCYGGYHYWDPLWTSDYSYLGLGCGGAVKLSQELSYHFSGVATGPALGLLVQEELLGAGAFTGLVVAPKFTWDLQLHPRLGLYLAPSVALGYRLLAWRGYPSVHAADIQAGLALKLALAERWLVWLQPAAFDFTATPGFFIARYDLLLGVGAAF